jgi:XTP/dITP diphosphohydrolase
VSAVRKLVLASGNAGKLRELREILGGDWELVPQAELGIQAAKETGQTFVENALLKARHAARLSRSPALADDSGLEVDALGGAPGVHSARYAGPTADDEANCRKLLQALAGVSPEGRTARFRCVIAVVRQADDAAPIVAEACWAGRIAEAPRGDGGFGYDPVFVDLDTGRTAAELPAAVKNAVSHRARALRELRARLEAGLDGP